MNGVTKNRLYNGTLLAVFLTVVYFLMGGCVKTQPPPIGPEIVQGNCAYSGIVLAFFKGNYPKELPSAVVPLPRGCRCAIMINGVEYIPSDVVPDQVCEEQMKKLEEENGKGTRGKPSTNSFSL